MKASDALIAKAKIWHTQIAALIAMAEKLGKEPPNLRIYYERLSDLYRTEGPLSALQDTADIVVRAQGPAMVGDPMLIDINWLFSSVHQQFKGLVAASFNERTTDAAKLAAHIPVVLTGIAPGSFFAGFRVTSENAAGPTDMWGQESKESIVQGAREALDSLTFVPKFVTDTEIDTEIYEQVPDAALRDASLMAAYHLSPTGRRGIHTLQFSKPNSDLKPAELDTRDRVVLRETVVKKPLIRATKYGSFMGFLRGVDLDKTRVMLRDVDGVGSLRCAVNLSEDQARSMLGKKVVVKGHYEENKHGKPSMLIVETIEKVLSLF